MTNEKQKSGDKPLKNSDFIAWRVSNYRRRQRDNEIKNIFYTRDRERRITRH